MKKTWVKVEEAGLVEGRHLNEEARGMEEQVGNTVGRFYRSCDEGCGNGEVRVSL